VRYQIKLGDEQFFRVFDTLEDQCLSAPLEQSQAQRLQPLLVKANQEGFFDPNMIRRALEEVRQESTGKLKQFTVRRGYSLLPSE
jgi:hypothetical protein